MSAAQPIPLLYSGRAGNYFGTEYEGLAADVHPEIQAVGQLLIRRGLVYRGKLTCSQFSQVEVYAFTTGDRRVAVSVMVAEPGLGGIAGLGGIDCVCKFADSSFLTTTTVQVLPNAYDEQKLFRISLPGLPPEELLDQHLAHTQDFEQQAGAVQPIFENLLSIAQMVDEYTLRQQANPGHGWFQFANGLAQAGMSQDSMSQRGSSDQDAAERELNHALENVLGNAIENALENELEDALNHALEDALENEENFVQLDRIEYDLNRVSPLIKAILQDNLSQVEKLLAEGAIVNPGWKEQVPLVAAVYRGNPEIVQTLIAAGADLNRLDMTVNILPLGMAIRQNRADLVKLLLDAGASPEAGSLDETALTLAIRCNSLSIVQMLLEAGVNPNAAMEDNNQAIMVAAALGRLEMVQMLVAGGADVNAWSQGDTAISYAARNAHQEVYDYLYPLLDAETRRYADKHGQKEMEQGMKRIAREANKLAEKLGDAALFGKLEKVQELLAAGADPNALTEGGKSPLMLAAMHGHLSVMEALLDAGADPNLGSEEEYEEGGTALMCIASSFFASNRAEVIQFLVDRGANVNAQDAQGRTALIAAGDNVDAVKALIAAGADLNLRDNEGNTALMLGTKVVQQLLLQAGASAEGLNDVELIEAADKGDLTRLEELLQAGANVNYSDGKALVAAAGRGDLAIVDRLIAAGARVNLGWKTGFTPIARAAYEGYLAIVERLLSAGADPFQRTHDDEYYDALDYARVGQVEGHHKGQEHGAIIELLSRQLR